MAECDGHRPRRLCGGKTLPGMLVVRIAEASCSKASFLDGWRTFDSIITHQSSYSFVKKTFGLRKVLMLWCSRYPQFINIPTTTQLSNAAGSCRNIALSTAYNSGRSCLNSPGSSKKYSTETAKNSGWLVPA